MQRKADPKQNKTFAGKIKDDFSDDCPPSPEDNITDMPVGGKKRSQDEMLEFDSNNFSNEMQKMLTGLGADIWKTMSSKRKKLEEFTQYSLKTSNKKIDEIWKSQQLQRTELLEEYQKQASAVFSQWESDLEKTKEQEDKITALYRQQQKIFQQCRVIQNQRLRQLRQLHEQFKKGIEDLSKSQEDQAQSSVQSELKKEMALLLKRILMENQQREMATVRESIHSMWF